MSLMMLALLLPHAEAQRWGAEVFAVADAVAAGLNDAIPEYVPGIRSPAVKFP